MSSMRSPFASYVIVGSVTTSIDFAIFIALTYMVGLHYLTSGMIAFVCAVLVNYRLCVRHVFTSAGPSERVREIAFTFVVSVLGLALHQGMLYALVEHGHLPIMVGKVAAVLSVLAWNYFGRKHWVFAKRRCSETAAR